VITYLSARHIRERGVAVRQFARGDAQAIHVGFAVVTLNVLRNIEMFFLLLGFEFTTKAFDFETSSVCFE